MILKEFINAIRTEMGEDLSSPIYTDTQMIGFVNRVLTRLATHNLFDKREYFTSENLEEDENQYKAVRPRDFLRYIAAYGADDLEIAQSNRGLTEVDCVISNDAIFFSENHSVYVLEYYYRPKFNKDNPNYAIPVEVLQYDELIFTAMKRLIKENELEYDEANYFEEQEMRETGKIHFNNRWQKMGQVKWRK